MEIGSVSQPAIRNPDQPDRAGLRGETHPCLARLLDGRLLEILTQPADIGGDMHRFDVGDLIDVGARFAPGEEAPAGVEIGGAGVRVLDRDGEEFEEAARAVVAGGGNQRGCHGRPSVGDARHGAGFGWRQVLRVAIGKSMQIRSASDRAISRNEIGACARRSWGDQGLSRHDLVPSQPEQGIDITARILESRDSETKVRVGGKMSHGLAPIVCSGCGLRGSVYRRPDWVHG